MGNLGDIVSKAAEEIGDVAEKVSQVLSDPAVQKAAEYLRPIHQGGNSRQYINTAVILITLSVVSVCLLAYLFLEGLLPVWLLPRKGRPRAWVILTLVVSYSLLLPSLVQVLFSFNVAISLIGIRVNLTSLDGHPSNVTESMISVVQLLFETGGTAGALLVILYAMIVPALKMVLLLLGEYFRFSDDIVDVRFARRCIQLVQFVSKWACPDMFAYILLLYLLRHVGNQFDFVDVESHLDIGFVCFSAFCILSTLSSLAVDPPGDESLDEKESQDPGSPRARKPLPWIVQFVGTHRFVYLSATVALLFAAFVAIGVLVPSMGLRLEMTMLIEPAGPLPESMRPALESLHLERLAKAEVGLWDCAASMFRESWARGEAACVFAFLMIFVFVLLCSWLDMLFLLVVSIDLHNSSALVEGSSALPVKGQAIGKSNKLAGFFPSDPLEMSRVLKHVSMLDVSIMGVFIICLAASMYEDMGVVFELKFGLVVLIAAEAMHYTMYYIVTGVAEHCAALADEA